METVISAAELDAGAAVANTHRIVRGQLAKLVIRYRKRLGMRVPELASKAKLGRRTLERLETGLVRHPNMITVQRLADALQLNDVERQAFKLAADYHPLQDNPVLRPAEVAVLLGMTTAQFSKAYESNHNTWPKPISVDPPRWLRASWAMFLELPPQSSVPTPDQSPSKIRRALDKAIARRRRRSTNGRKR